MKKLSIVIVLLPFLVASLSSCQDQTSKKIESSLVGYIKSRPGYDPKNFQFQISELKYKETTEGYDFNFTIHVVENGYDTTIKMTNGKATKNCNVLPFKNMVQ